MPPGKLVRPRVARFVAWYNGEHRHSALRYVTPDHRHFGPETGILARRHAVYQRTRDKKPGRWSRATRDWKPIVVLDPQMQGFERLAA